MLITRNVFVNMQTLIEFILDNPLAKPYASLVINTSPPPTSFQLLSSSFFLYNSYHKSVITDLVV